jgi:hypothetical protein
LLQTIPSLAWSIPNVTTLIDAELAETQPLEHIVGDASRYYGLRMRIIAQSALLADALIAAAPPAHVQVCVSRVCASRVRSGPARCAQKR